MIYITGDTHGDFERFERFCNEMHTSTEDIMIILGDAGLNYYGDFRDVCGKAAATQYPLTFFCIHGNHEMRPATLPAYKTREFCGGTVWVEETYPNILFARDGDVYNLGGRECIVIGGAYSVDKYIRQLRGYRWFEDEQPSDEIKAHVEQVLESRGNRIDIVLSHTCPLKYEPIEALLSSIDQRKVDRTTEEWLDKLEERIEYRDWYCGHYHTRKRAGRLRLMYEDIDALQVN